MFIDKNSIQVKIDGMANYLSLGDYLVEVKYSFDKLYDNSSGRNLAGSMVATLIGHFPKIVLQFGRLTKTQLETIIPILDATKQSFKYYDPNKKTTVTMETYTGNYDYINKHIITGNSTNEPFSVSFIAVRKRA